MTTDDPQGPLPSTDELTAGALDLLKRHFNAINEGDKHAFRDTAHLFDRNDGVPFERWWSGMRSSLSPLDVELTPSSVDTRVRPRGARAQDNPPHIAVWVSVVARSRTTGRTYSDRFVAWFLIGSRTWKLGCRMHWYSDA